ncbi:FtsX-like permease family protein [Plantactinospora soyae]|uniref:ABC transport system permease protein n=1 Tax=Plantactinospora soyae TaxID=1544732 RepID=A0A927QYR6_9ACTN|nr:FtsX-like permease family protein [Plantactinospora soyae]MBE1489525.1 putative ABC transport system permease protein [Plantactinospora soyae]
MNGRLLLVCRLLVRDLRRRRTETVLLLVAITAATATLTLGLALNELLSRPYEQTRAATAGPDLVVEPARTGPEALAALAPLTTAPGVTGHSGPYPLLFKALTARDLNVRVVVEGRDAAPAALDRPAVTDGTWVRPGGVVVERAFADALGVHRGDTVSIDGHPLRVAGTAVTAARPAYPYAGWHLPGSILSEAGGLVWVDRSDIATLAGTAPLTFTLNLKLADPQAGISVVDPSHGDPRFRGWHFNTWQQIAEVNGRLNHKAQEALLVGSWLLTVLALAGVAGIVAGRVIGQRRRVGLLKAAGAGPVMIAAVHLAEYLVIGLAAAGTGLAAGWLAAPPLFRPTAGLIGSVGVQPPLRVVAAATTLALGIAIAATLVPVVRAAATDTIHMLADAAAPPRRRRWIIWLSRRLPTALLIGVRINARRPRRARLVTVNTLVTTAILAAVLMAKAQDHTPVPLGYSTLPDRRDERIIQAILLVALVACVLALINAIVSTWTAVLDARQPLVIARALGATPGQAGTGLAVAQLLPAVPGIAAGIPIGIGLYLFFTNGDLRYAPVSWILALALGVLLAIAALTAIPALAAARHPVGDTLQSVPT